MAQIFELLKGKIDVSKYEEEQKLRDGLKKLERELDSLNNEIFSNTLGQMIGYYNSRLDSELRTKKINKEKQIKEYKFKYNLM